MGIQKMHKVLAIAAALLAGSGSAQAQDWTGFYAGVNAGYGKGQFQSATLIGFPVLFSDPDGFLGGAQAGANIQVDSFVFGVEADFQKSGISGADPCACFPISFQVDEFGTLRARAGVAFDNFLIYGTGGVAFGRGVLDLGGGFQLSGSYNSGWAGGVGLEAMLFENISFKGEYLHVDLGAQNYAGMADFGLSFHTVRAGINYHF